MTVTAVILLSNRGLKGRPNEVNKQTVETPEWRKH